MEEAMSIPPYLAFIVLGADIAIIAAILLGLHQSLAAADWPVGLGSRTIGTFAGVLTAWFALAVGTPHDRHQPQRDADEDRKKDAELDGGKTIRGATEEIEPREDRSGAAILARRRPAVPRARRDLPGLVRVRKNTRGDRA